MPYYSNQTDPTEMAQLSGNPFYNPLQPGPDFVRGVQSIYAMMEQNKQKKKAEKEQADQKFKEDMMFQMKLKADRQAAELRAKQLKQIDREAQDYIPPKAKQAFELFTRGIEEANKHKNALEEIKLRTEGALKVAQARTKSSSAETAKIVSNLDKEYKKAKTAIESAYTTDLTNIENSFSTEVARIRANPKLLETQDATQASPYLIALRGAMASRKRKRDELADRKAQQIEALEREYSIKKSQAAIPPPPEGFTIDIQ